MLHLAAIAFGAGVRFLLLALPPLFVTDVTIYNAQAVGYLLRGVDPYGAAYIVPPTLATPGASNVFAYLPGVFLFIVPADAVWGASLGLVAADLVVVWMLLELSGPRRWVAASMFALFPPVILFSTSFLNDALPAVAFLMVAIVFEERGGQIAAGVAWGLAFASSQEAWFILPLYAAFCFRRRGFSGFIVSLLTASASMMPFLLWNPQAFLQDMLVFQFARPGVAFVSSGPFGVNVNPSLQGILLSFGASAPPVVRGGLAILAVALALWRFDGNLRTLALWSGILTSICLFLMAGEIFWSYLELPLVLLLAWFAINRHSYDSTVSEPSTLKERPEG
jgi:hypothetical protein